MNKHSSDIEIKIDPISFRDTQYSLSNIDTKCFVNLSSTIIPEEVQSFLQLGDNFNLPATNNNKFTVEFKNFQNNLRKFPLNKQIAIQNRSAHIFNKLPTHSILKCPVNTIIKQRISATKKFLNDNQY